MQNYTQLYHFQVREYLTIETTEQDAQQKPRTVDSLPPSFQSLCFGSSCLKMRLEKFTLFILAIVIANSLGKEFSPIVCVCIYLVAVTEESC